MSEKRCKELYDLRAEADQALCIALSTMECIRRLESC